MPGFYTRRRHLRTLIDAPMIHTGHRSTDLKPKGDDA